MKLRFELVLALLFALLVALLIAAACSGKAGRSAEAPGKEAAPDTKAEASYSSIWPALALLKTGENPLWFEFGKDGPAIIEAPDRAALIPYAPWPHARYITGMQIHEGSLVMALNRDGFLVLAPAAPSLQSPAEPRAEPSAAKPAAAKPPVPQTQAPAAPPLQSPAAAKPSAAMPTAPAAPFDTDVIMYRVSDYTWDPYTTESFFVWENKPAVLLYRNDFFSELAAPSPVPQVYILDKASPVPLGAAIPALETFPPGGSWEAEVLHRGPDGLWYFRMKEKEKLQPETAYYRSADLGRAGEKISAGEWRTSSRPEGCEKMPGFLSAVFGKAEFPGFAKYGAVKINSPDFEGERIFYLPANRSAGAAVPAGSAAAPAVSTMTAAPAGSAAPPASTASAAPAVSTMTAAPGEEAEITAPLLGFFESSGPLALIIRPDGSGIYAAGEGADPGSFSLPALPENFVYTGIALLGKVLAVSWEEQQEAGIGAAGFMVLDIHQSIQLDL